MPDAMCSPVACNLEKSLHHQHDGEELWGYWVNQNSNCLNKYVDICSIPC